MGSLDDLVIHPLNGHPVTDDELGPVNRQLSELLSQVHRHGRRLKHELDKP